MYRFTKKYLETWVPTLFRLQAVLFCLRFSDRYAVTLNSPIMMEAKFDFNRKFSCKHHLSHHRQRPSNQNSRSRVQLTHDAFDVKPRTGFMEILFEIQRLNKRSNRCYSGRPAGKDLHFTIHLASLTAIFFKGLPVLVTCENKRMKNGRRRWD